MAAVLTRDLPRLAAQVHVDAPPLEMLERRWTEVSAPIVRARPSGRAYRAVALVTIGVAAALIAAVAVTGHDIGRTIGRVETTPSSDGAAGHSPAATFGRVTPALSSQLVAVASDGVLLGPGSTHLGTGSPAVGPRWSSDGRWVAYAVIPTTAGGQELRVATASGGSDRVVWAGDVTAWSWSSSGPDLLSIEPAGGGLAVVSPAGVVRWVLPPGTPVVSAAWRGAALTWTATAGAPLGVWGSTGSSVTLPPGLAGSELIIARWVGDGHLLAWQAQPGSVEDNGLPLLDLAVDGTAAQLVGTLATTLVSPAWVVPGPSGTAVADAVLIVAGGGALPWTGKSVERCDVDAATCSALAPPGVTLDPAWSPDGTQVAFVAAGSPSALPAGSTVATWFPTRRLWVASADGSDAHQVSGSAPGVTAPSWTADGSWIRYSTADSIAAIPAAGGEAVTLLAGLSAGGGGAGPDGYGKEPWTGLAAWAP